MNSTTEFLKMCSTVLKGKKASVSKWEGREHPSDGSHRRIRRGVRIGDRKFLVLGSSLADGPLRLPV